MDKVGIWTALATRRAAFERIPRPLPQDGIPAPPPLVDQEPVLQDGIKPPSLPERIEEGIRSEVDDVEGEERIEEVDDEGEECIEEAD